jgi:hypothetical protein
MQCVPVRATCRLDETDGPRIVAISILVSRIVRVLVAFLGLLIPTLVLAAPTQEIRFPRGASEATVENAVVRGDRDLYTLDVRAGQTLRLRITSTEGNAVFQIYPPGTTYRVKDGVYDFAGRALAGAGEADDAVIWSGALPQSGKYLIVVGSTRGNASYRLNVATR